MKELLRAKNKEILVLMVILLLVPSSRIWAVIGSEAYLITNMNYPHVAVNEAALDEYIRVMASRDLPEGVTDLYRQRKLFQVENKVKVRILATDLGKTKVRILEGNKKGSSGWVISEWLKHTLESPENKNKGMKANLQFTTSYPKGIPKGYTGALKFKYRIIENINNVSFTLCDTNKIEKITGGFRASPPIFLQEYHKEWTGKWVKRTIRDQMEFLPEYLTFMENHALKQQQ